MSRLIIMGKRNLIKFKVNDIVFDTADSVVLMSYDIKRDYLGYVEATSRLCDIQQSTKEWCDMASYGQCVLDIFSMDILIEIADSIKDKEWLYIYNAYSSWDAKKPLKDDSIKQAVLKRLYNARTDLSDFIAEKLKEGGFDDITAHNNHIHGKGYSVVMSQNDIIRRISEISLNDVFVNFMNEDGEKYLTYAFHREKEENIFLSAVYYHNYEDNKETEMSIFGFNLNGELCMEKRNLVNGDVEERESIVDVSCNWDMYPEFGDYSGLIVLERGLNI